MPPSSPRLSERAISDASLQAAEQAWLALACCQVQPGAYQGHLSRLSIGGTEIFVERQNRTVHKFGRIPEDRCTVSVVAEACESGWFMQRRLDDDASVFLLPGGAEFDVYLPGHASTLYLACDFNELMGGLRALDPEGWAARPTTLLAVEPRQRNAFLQAMLQAIALARAGGHGRLDADSLKRCLIDAALTALHEGRTPQPARRDRPPRFGRRLKIVKRARDFMHTATLEQRSASLTDLCAFLGVSERTLQYSFRALMDTTPQAYWRVLRLNAARGALLSRQAADNTVTAIAHEHGFFHLGRFALDYRRQFGESPSTTLTAA